MSLENHICSGLCLQCCVTFTGSENGQAGCTQFNLPMCTPLWAFQVFPKYSHSVVVQNFAVG